MTVRQPCPSCPWRKGQDAQDIPNFNLQLAEELADTCPDQRGYGPEFGARIFACHQSKPGEEIVCAGWLSQVGGRHPNIRIKVIAGEISHEALQPRDDMHDSFTEVIEKLRESA